jgi:hypothetical protein
MSETIITVEGGFDHHHPAERGTVLVTAGFQGPERDGVVARTAQLHSRIAGEAQQLHSPTGGPVTWWSSERLRAWSERPWNNEGKQLPLVHHASIDLEVKFSDLRRLAEWTEGLASVDGVTIGGIRWALTEVTTTRLATDARHRAVLDAVEKATSYAHSLGLYSLQPIALADPGMLGDGTRPTTPASAEAMQFSRKAAASEPAIDLKPEDITIGSRVHARFVAS